MGTSIFLAAVVLLVIFAIFDLIVGVSNDAANFLNSSIGSKVAPRKVILLIASLGILAGVTFSSGMMEVARKGIFHPEFFTMPDLLTIFLAVMLTDVILLDLFNTYGMPTSTTVSIVFELLGAAVAVSILKIVQASGSLLTLGQYINTGKALTIIFGILFSVVVAFFFGALVQFFTRLIFTFDYKGRFLRYGGLWGGISMSSIFYFILIKGAKGASFLTPESYASIKEHSLYILIASFIVFTVIFQILLFLKVNILKPIILMGTFALAMAFAANDLVNFIGVPLAGLASYTVAMASDAPLEFGMAALGKNVQSNTFLLLLAGFIMVITLWVSKKSRTVSATEISLGSQEEGQERFDSFLLSRTIVRMWLNVFMSLRNFIPGAVRAVISRRMDPDRTPVVNIKTTSESARFDLIRASVNLMVASGVISYATSNKLPLSTTYVTFMVAMGTSFADRAWGRDSAVFRISGVLTVIGGWFMTAMSAFMIAFVFALVMFYTHLIALPVILILIGYIIWANHKKHEERAEQKIDDRVFNLKKVKDAGATVATTFEHMSYLIGEIRVSLDTALTALFRQDLSGLKAEARKIKKIQNWSNIEVANIFKALRLLQRNNTNISYKYSGIIRRIQRFSDCYRDTVLRASTHLDNQHKGLLENQINELSKVRALTIDLLGEAEATFSRQKILDFEYFLKKYDELLDYVQLLDDQQIDRIISGESKTRLSILYYSIAGNSRTMAKQLVRLMDIFRQSLLKADIESKS